MVLVAREAGLVGQPPGATWSGLAVQVELVRVRPERDLLGARSPEGEVGLDDVGGEDVAAVEELLVGLERVERLLERSWGAGDAALLLLAQLVDVLVHGRRRLDLVDDAVEAGEQLRRERQVRVAGRVG